MKISKFLKLETSIEDDMEKYLLSWTRYLNTITKTVKLSKKTSSFCPLCNKFFAIPHDICPNCGSLEITDSNNIFEKIEEKE